MKTWLKFFPLFLAAAAVLLGGATLKAPEETIALFDSHKVTVAVPDGFAFSKNPAPNEPLGFKLADTKGRFSLDCVFVPDGDDDLSSARGRREKLVELFNSYVESSTEKGMQFEELEPRTGAGTYCVFTDANLVGKTQLPPGEFLHLTAGIKTFPGVVAVFRLFSDDTTSSEYRAVLKMLRESVDEKPVPLK